ncbi:DUF4276 family protein [Hymenobacter sp. M29]|uniref:DUF4276 family protein n=1 Tax=Hymenobacter mellowenesis TaxID=3063995 RepID=A0ABT9AF06_9BACT|nr:DUF4276 family protein [Hymenobacter sp. M29]MDO7848443.1 DUF4276 family protein [Hymenobacter sp. M29]
MRVEFLVEELSAKAALEQLLPRLLPGCACRVRAFEGWRDLLSQLPALLQGYHRRIMQQGESDLRIVVLLDGDGICARRKADLEARAKAAGLITKAMAAPGQVFHVLNRIAVQELEAWWLGDRQAIMAAYEGVKPHHFKGIKERETDVPLKPSEVLWAVLKQGRHFLAGKQKTRWATDISQHIEPARNNSPSFCAFRDGLAALH